MSLGRHCDDFSQRSLVNKIFGGLMMNGDGGERREWRGRRGIGTNSSGLSLALFGIVAMEMALIIYQIRFRDKILSIVILLFSKQGLMVFQRHTCRISWCILKVTEYA